MYDLAPTGHGRHALPLNRAETRPVDDPQPITARRTAAQLAIGGVAIALVMISTGLLLTRLLAHSELMRFDLSTERWLAGHRSPALNHVTLGATWLAETPIAIAMATLAFIGLRMRLHRWRESWVVATAVIGELLVFLSTTALIDRARPPVHRLDGAPPTSSFPSGHTGAAIAIYGSLAALVVLRSSRPVRWPLAVLLILIPFAVGASRLYRGMHFPTDVVAGALNGLLWVILSFAVLLPKRPRIERDRR